MSALQTDIRTEHPQYSHTQSIMAVVRCMRNEFECAFASGMEMIKAFHPTYNMYLENHMASAYDTCNVQEYPIDVCLCVVIFIQNGIMLFRMLTRHLLFILFLYHSPFYIVFHFSIFHMELVFVVEN